MLKVIHYSRIAVYKYGCMRQLQVVSGHRSKEVWRMFAGQLLQPLCQQMHWMMMMMMMCAGQLLQPPVSEDALEDSQVSVQTLQADRVVGEGSGPGVHESHQEGGGRDPGEAHPDQAQGRGVSDGAVPGSQ